MKKLLAGLIVVGSFVVGRSVLADYTDTWVSTTLKVPRVCIDATTPGNASAVVYGIVRTADGGVINTEIGPVTLAGNNLDAGVDVLGKGLQLLKSKYPNL